jgi:hypothetical protein
MGRVAAKFLPRLLTGAQKQYCVAVSQELFDPSNASLLSRFKPCGLFRCTEVEILTKGSRFKTVEETEENSTRDLRAIT